MPRSSRRAAICCLTILSVGFLSACGNGNDAPNPLASGRAFPPPTLALAHTSITAGVIPGYTSLFIEVSVNGETAGGSPIYVLLADPAGVIRPFSRAVGAGQTVDLDFKVDASLPPKEYKGIATVSVGSADGSKIYDSVALTYDLLLHSARNLTTLTPLAGVTDWQTEGGDNAHDFHVPVTLDPKAFSVRWILSGVDPHTYPKGGVNGTAPV